MKVYSRHLVRISARELRYNVKQAAISNNSVIFSYAHNPRWNSNQVLFPK